MLKYRVTRTSIGSTPEYSSLNLTPRHTFGSSSSISSGSAPGSARKKKPAPRPPIPSFKDHYGPSSLNFSPSHSAVSIFSFIYRFGILRKVFEKTDEVVAMEEKKTDMNK